MNVEHPDLKSKVRDLPHKPGIYIYKDEFNRVIYVGKAVDLHKRVAQYFHPSKKYTADPKTRALIQSIRDLEYHTVKSDPEAILLEGKLIKQYRPRYNISFRDDKHFLLVKVNLNDPFPRFELTRLRKDDGCRYFGPFAHSGALRSTLNLMRKKFNLRSCRPPIPKETDFKHCLDHIIKQCSAPCMNKITRAGYLAKVHEACEFLEGKSAEMLENLRAEMTKAAGRLDFEKAAKIRNMLDDITSTTKPQKRFVRDFPTGILPQQDIQELQEILQLPQIPSIIECFDISNISTTHKVASMVCFKDGKPHRADYRRYRIKSVEGQDDFASMAEVIRRRYSRVKQEKIRVPDLIVVDGGKGQLSSAREELLKLGMPHQPIIGLAKQNEEIFTPASSEPIVLSHDMGALKLLQRIRDEAHRFANGYHQLLMKKRMAESILDECPGINTSRKMTLLRHFGSVENIRKATSDQISEVRGISSKLALQIFDFFQSRTEKN